MLYTQKIDIGDGNNNLFVTGIRVGFETINIQIKSKYFIIDADKVEVIERLIKRGLNDLDIRNKSTMRKVIIDILKRNASYILTSIKKLDKSANRAILIK